MSWAVQAKWIHIRWRPNTSGKFNSFDVVEPKSLKPCLTSLEIGNFVKMKNLLFKGDLSSWIWKRGCVDQNSFHSSQGWERECQKSKDIRSNIIIIVPSKRRTRLESSCLFLHMVNCALAKCYIPPIFILVAAAELWCQKSVGKTINLCRHQ